MARAADGDGARAEEGNSGVEPLGEDSNVLMPAVPVMRGLFMRGVVSDPESTPEAGTPAAPDPDPDQRFAATSSELTPAAIPPVAAAFTVPSARSRPLAPPLDASCCCCCCCCAVPAAEPRELTELPFRCSTRPLESSSAAIDPAVTPCPTAAAAPEVLDTSGPECIPDDGALPCNPPPPPPPSRSRSRAETAAWCGWCDVAAAGE